MGRETKGSKGESKTHWWTDWHQPRYVSPNCVGIRLSRGTIHLTEQEPVGTVRFGEAVRQGWGARPCKTGRFKNGGQGMESKINDLPVSYMFHILKPFFKKKDNPYSSFFTKKAECHMCCLFKGQRWPERLTRGICSDSRCTETVFNIKHNPHIKYMNWVSWCGSTVLTKFNFQSRFGLSLGT